MTAQRWTTASISNGLSQHCAETPHTQSCLRRAFALGIHPVRGLIVFALLLVAVETSAADSARVDFDTDVLPILTKSGCNAAACHGSAAGRGGFKLSLFGGEPALDHQEIVQRLEGRRVNFVSPENSLLVVKPTMELDHEGGLRFDYDSAPADTLRDWIHQGAQRLTVRQLDHLEIEPLDSILAQPGSELQISVTAVFDDGSRRDVTSSTVFSSTDVAAVQVDATGKCSVHRRGRHAVILRYLSQVSTVQITVPLSEIPVDLSEHVRGNWIDDEVLRMLATLRLPTSPPATDAAMLRRLRLDLTGRLPSVDEIRTYLDDSNCDKYSVLVDRLLASDDFTEYWTYKLAKLLRIRAQPNDTSGARAFHQWIREQLQGEARWDKIVVEMLLADGDTHQVGPANFYRVARDARGQAEYVSELLMGVRLRCANCHNHPLDHWTQDDYHGLSAIFARIQQGRQVRVRSRGEVIHPATGEPAVPRIPGEQFLDPTTDGRHQLANWLTQPENTYFAKAIVNRLWKAMLGRGLIEPSDDLRATNPPTNSALLDRLTSDFVNQHFKLRHTIRLIANSATYQRDSRPNQLNQVDDRFYSHTLIRPLEPEVLADVLADVTGVPEHYETQPPGTRAVALFNPATPSRSLDVLGRCSRQDSCEASDAAASRLTTKLHLINGPLINGKLGAPNARLTSLITAGRSTSDIVEQFYLAALSRLPTTSEQRFWQRKLQGDGDHRTELLEDFVWSLLNSREFMTNH